MKNGIVIASAVFGLGILALVFYLYNTLGPSMNKVIGQFHTEVHSEMLKETQQFKSQFLADQTYIQNRNLFTADYSRRGRDAGSYLNKFLNFREQNRSLKTVLDIDRKLQNQLVIVSERWTDFNLPSGFDVSKLEWMKNLKDFKFWSEETEGLHQVQLKKDPLYDFVSNPVKYDLSIFILWAKIRWLAQVKQNLAGAQRETRQLARLIYSRGTYQAAKVAQQILELEVDLEINLGQREEFAQTLFKFDPVNKEDLKVMKRFFRASASILQTASAITEHYELFDQLVLGRCLALHGTKPDLLMLYKPLYVISIMDHYARLTDYIKKENCSRRRFQTVWNNDQFTLKHMKGKDVSKQISKHFALESKSHKGLITQFHMQSSGKSGDIFQMREFKLAARIFSQALLVATSENPWKFYSSNKNRVKK